MVEMMKFLIERGGDVRSKDGLRRTGLHTLCCNYLRRHLNTKEDELGSVELAKLLGVDVATDETGRTAFHYQLETSKDVKAMLELFIEKGIQC